ncbi:MAG: hypothetical protein J2P34_09280, partial [Actinobacteria bacterium]|nr:hypothetical protein [Actinomycetota bacterium]
MSTTTTSTPNAIAIVRPLFTESERLALAGFLAGYRDLTREAYSLTRPGWTATRSARSWSPPASARPP